VNQYQKKHSPTHTYPDHQPSFISFLHVLRSIASSLLNLCGWQSLHHLSPGPLSSTSWSGTLHFIHFAHSLSSFCNSCPYHCNLFCGITKIMWYIPNLSSNSLLGTLIFYTYLNVTHPSDHSHLWPLKCHLIFFPYRPGLTSMQHTTSHTTAIQSPSHNQWYIPIGRQWYQVPVFIQSN